MLLSENSKQGSYERLFLHLLSWEEAGLDIDFLQEKTLKQLSPMFNALIKDAKSLAGEAL